jgi:hypothetical protein
MPYSKFQIIFVFSLLSTYPFGAHPQTNGTDGIPLAALARRTGITGRGKVALSEVRDPQTTKGGSSVGGTPLTPLAKEPAASEGVQYVLATGNDANDGLSPGTAKLTVWAAVEALPGGSAGPPAQSGSGVVYIGADVRVGAPGGGGLHIVGPGSPTDFAAPPKGWIRVPTSLALRCFSPLSGALFATGPACAESWSSGPSDAAIWRQGTSQAFSVDGFRFAYQGTAIRLGVDAAGNRNNVGDQDSHFSDVAALGGGSSVGWGPQIDIGSNVFWDTFDHVTATGSKEQWTVNLSRANNVVTGTIVAGGVGGTTHDIPKDAHVSVYYSTDVGFNGTFTVTSTEDNQHFTYTQIGPDAKTLGSTAFSDRVFGMLVDPAGGAGSGGINVYNYTGTGIKFYGGKNGGDVRVYDSFTEAPFIINPPGVWVSGQFANALVSSFEVADIPSPSPAVVNDGRGRVEANYILGSGCDFDGPMIVTGALGHGPCQSGMGFSNEPASFARAGAGSAVDSQRSFGSLGVRFSNLISQVPSDWFFNRAPGIETVTTGQPAPDGTTAPGATKVAARGGELAIVYTSPRNTGSLPVTLAVGQWFVFSAWVLAVNGTGYRGGTGALKFQLTGAGDLWSGDFGLYGSNGGAWDHVWFARKVIAAPTPSATIAIWSDIDDGNPIMIYAPTLVQIPAGLVSDNEAVAYAYNLGSYGTNCPIGSLCGLPGQTLAVSGSTPYMGLFTQSNSANRTYALPDISGSIPIGVDLTGSPGMQIIKAGACTENSIPYPNAAATDTAYASPTYAVEAGLTWSAYVVAGSGVRYRVCNSTASNIATSGGARWKVKLFR